MNESVLKLENITDEKFNEMISTGWELMSVDHFRENQVIYSFIKIN